MPTLTATKRDKKKSLAAIRREGLIPAVFYGRKEASTPITIPARDFTKLLKEAGESSVITIAGVGEDKDALINEVDTDPVTGIVRHADFYILEKGKAVQVKVALEFTGESGAVKNQNAVLVKVMHELEIEAMPKDLPHSISVDISVLENLDAQIHVKDLKLPSGVTALVNPEDVVALVSQAKEEPEEPVAAPDLSTIEVEKKGKEEESAPGTAGAAGGEKKE